MQNIGGMDFQLFFSKRCTTLSPINLDSRVNKLVNKWINKQINDSIRELLQALIFHIDFLLEFYLFGGIYHMHY